MSDNPADGVTNEFGRIHDTTNCYVVGPALCPTNASPNPMLTGVALARRTADMLTNNVLPKPAPFVATGGFRPLFDGTGRSFNQWKRVSPNSSNGFALIRGQIVTYGNRPAFGLLYYAAEAFDDFTLKVQFRIFDTQNHNSGIFIRFRNPMLDPTPMILNRMTAEGDLGLFGSNRAWGAVYSGFEVQIDDHARGDTGKDFYGVRPEPDGLSKNRTGAIYKIPAKDPIPSSGQFDAERQLYQPGTALIPGRWYEYEIDVTGDTYTVDLSDLEAGITTRTSIFQNTDPNRGIGTENGQPAGYIGLRAYPGSPIAFRHIQISP